MDCQALDSQASIKQTFILFIWLKKYLKHANYFDIRLAAPFAVRGGTWIDEINLTLLFEYI